MYKLLVLGDNSRSIVGKYMMTICLKIIYATKAAPGIWNKILILLLKLFNIYILRLLKKEHKILGARLKQSCYIQAYLLLQF